MIAQRNTTANAKGDGQIISFFAIPAMMRSCHKASHCDMVQVSVESPLSLRIMNLSELLEFHYFWQRNCYLFFLWAKLQEDRLKELPQNLPVRYPIVSGVYLYIL